MDCERCGKGIKGEPLFGENLCDECTHDLLVPGVSTGGHDWGHWDFEKGEYKK